MHVAVQIIAYRGQHSKHFVHLALTALHRLKRHVKWGITALVKRVRYVWQEATLQVLGLAFVLYVKVGITALEVRV